MTFPIYIQYKFIHKNQEKRDVFYTISYISLNEVSCIKSLTILLVYQGWIYIYKNVTSGSSQILAFSITDTGTCSTLLELQEGDVMDVYYYDGNDSEKQPLYDTDKMSGFNGFRLQ